MVSGTRTIYPHVYLIKGSVRYFSEGYTDRQATDKGWKVKRSKCGANKELNNDDISSSQKYQKFKEKMYTSFLFTSMKKMLLYRYYAYVGMVS